MIETKLDSNFKIFLGGIPGKLDENKLNKFFTDEGAETILLEVPKNSKKPTLTRGYAILHLQNEQSYNLIMKKKTYFFNGRVIHAKPYLEGPSLEANRVEYEKRKIYVGDVPKEWDKTLLYQALQGFGNIDDAFVIIDPVTKLSQGFGYVEFKSAKIAQKALELGKLEKDGVVLRFEKCNRLVAKIEKEKKKAEEEKIEEKGSQGTFKINHIENEVEKPPAPPTKKKKKEKIIKKEQEKIKNEPKPKIGKIIKKDAPSTKKTIKETPKSTGKFLSKS